jgi:hypothetical protein
MFMPDASSPYLSYADASAALPQGLLVRSATAPVVHRRNCSEGLYEWTREAVAHGTSAHEGGVGRLPARSRLFPACRVLVGGSLSKIFLGRFAVLSILFVADCVWIF